MIYFNNSGLKNLLKHEIRNILNTSWNLYICSLKMLITHKNIKQCQN